VLLNFKKLQQLSDEIDWHSELNCLNFNQQWNHFLNTLINCLNASIPLCKPHARKNIMTHEAIYMKNVKNKLLETLHVPQDWDAFCNASSKKLREDFEDDLTTSNPKRFW